MLLIRYSFSGKTDSVKNLSGDAILFSASDNYAHRGRAIFLIHTALRVDEKYSFYSKAAINIIVLALNFVFSQWIVFREKRGDRDA